MDINLSKQDILFLRLKLTSEIKEEELNADPDNLIAPCNMAQWLKERSSVINKIEKAYPRITALESLGPNISLAKVIPSSAERYLLTVK